jgi:hypothetical protein
MYENSDGEIRRIIRLVESCPEQLRAKAFEILLQAYVNSLLAGKEPSKSEDVSNRTQDRAEAAGGDEWATSVPADTLPRLTAMAKRRNVAAKGLAELFDFSADPFTFSPLHVPGKNKRERTLKVALLVGARTFLATGRWVADWAEIKAMCTHQNCYDLPNFAATMKGAKGGPFKSVTVGTGVDLSATGTNEAEQLLAALASPTDAASK